MSRSTILEPAELFSFCPKCGSEQIDRFENNNAIKCKECGLEYYFNASGAVIAIIQNDKAEVLVTKRAYEPYKGKLDLPGGFIMPGENAEEALIREVKEELNIDIFDLEYCLSLSNKYPYSGLFVNTIDFVFKAKTGDMSHMKADDDVASFAFVKPEDLKPDDFGIDSVRQVVLDIVSKPKP